MGNYVHHNSLRNKSWEITYDAQYGKKALMPHANREGPDQCASVLSNLGIFCSSTYITVSTDSENGK